MKINYDPLRDEFKKYTREEFKQILHELADDYEESFRGSLNEFQSNSNTFNEWLASFRRWISW